jgi:hypothetical protein
MPGLLKNVSRLRGKLASLQLDRAAKATATAQREFLLRLVAQNADSAFGREHSFASIRTVGEYRHQVQLRDFEGLRPYVNRIIAGELTVLTHEAPFMLTMTSGTTGEPKFIPVTRESQKLNSSLMSLWLHRALQDHPGLMDHSSIGIVSQAIEGHTISGLPYGSASGLIYKNIPWLIRRTYAVPYEVSELHDYDERYFVAARFALARRVSFIATPNPSTLIRLARTCTSQKERLVRALHDGTLGIDSPIQQGICAELATKLRPQRARAKALESIIKRTGDLRPADCWTNLKLIGCWTGGSSGMQARKLQTFYGAVPLRDLGYLSSEGRVTVPLEDNNASGILAIRNGFYEFIPEESADEIDPQVLLSHELEQGKRYSILLSTTNGLYRYKINDIVEVTGFYGEAPLLAFIRKGGEMANITGEKMHANHLTQAMDEVKHQFDLAIGHFRASPDFEASRYDIFIELEQETSPELLRDKVLPELDRILSRVNIEYAQKRQSHRLAAPILHLMQDTWVAMCLQRHMAAGKRDTQYKWQILGPERREEDTLSITRTIEIANDPENSSNPLTGSSAAT